MLSTLLEDACRIEGVNVATIVEPDYRDQLRGDCPLTVAKDAASRDHLFDTFASQTDATLLIAPEIDGILLGLANRVAETGGVLLSPDANFVEIASDKQSTCECWHRARVPTPRGKVVLAGEHLTEDQTVPSILKPISGCGSIGIASAQHQLVVPTQASVYRWEPLHAGLPASVTVLCHDDELMTLEPCGQQIAADGTFAYLGGWLPLEDQLAKRARGLAEAALRALPSTRGWVGIDLVLGPADDGSQDVVIEINPRFTTSYIGLRAGAAMNLLELMLDALSGKQVQPPAIRHSVSWTPDGRITRL